jgi:2-oxoglutarate ferredoxin oxidoreductase subunit beta
MDRKHMQEMFRRAHAHNGSALVEVFQNCNVFNDGAFAALTKKDSRDSMLIELVHGQPIRFGADNEKGVVLENGSARVVDVADVGEDAIIVHREDNPDSTVAYALSRLATTTDVPTPMGVFRAVERAEYGSAVNAQLASAQADKGPGDIETLLHSLPTWTVG